MRLACHKRQKYSTVLSTKSGAAPRTGTQSGHPCGKGARAHGSAYKLRSTLPCAQKQHSGHTRTRTVYSLHTAHGLCPSFPFFPFCLFFLVFLFFLYLFPFPFSLFFSFSPLFLCFFFLKKKPVLLLLFLFYVFPLPFSFYLLPLTSYLLPFTFTFTSVTTSPTHSPLHRATRRADHPHEPAQHGTMGGQKVTASLVKSQNTGKTRSRTQQLSN